MGLRRPKRSNWIASYDSIYESTIDFRLLPSDYAALREQASLFERMAAYSKPASTSSSASARTSETCRRPITGPLVSGVIARQERETMLVELFGGFGEGGRLETQGAIGQPLGLNAVI